jgi:hypothetical protein
MSEIAWASGSGAGSGRSGRGPPDGGERLLRHVLAAVAITQDAQDERVDGPGVALVEHLEGCLVAVFGDALEQVLVGHRLRGHGGQTRPSPWGEGARRRGDKEYRHRPEYGDTRSPDCDLALV